MFAALALTLLSATVAFALPSARSSGCSLTKAILSLPTGQSILVAPSTPTPHYIGIGVGVQNYTCTSGGNYTNVGAVAELFDVSCLNPSSYDEFTQLAFDAWKDASKELTAADLITDLAFIDPKVVLGQHYFITNPITGSGLSPKWDFTSASEKGHPDAFAVGAKVGDLPAPTDPATNIDWLQLKVVQGDLATQIYRVETKGGQPPSSCTPGSAEISVKYTSQYWLYGGTTF